MMVHPPGSFTLSRRASLCKPTVRAPQGFTGRVADRVNSLVEGGVVHEEQDDDDSHFSEMDETSSNAKEQELNLSAQEQPRQELHPIKQKRLSVVQQRIQALEKQRAEEKALNDSSKENASTSTTPVIVEEAVTARRASLWDVSRQVSPPRLEDARRASCIGVASPMSQKPLSGQGDYTTDQSSASPNSVLSKADADLDMAQAARKVREEFAGLYDSCNTFESMDFDDDDEDDDERDSSKKDMVVNMPPPPLGSPPKQDSPKKLFQRSVSSATGLSDPPKKPAQRYKRSASLMSVVSNSGGATTSCKDELSFALRKAAARVSAGEPQIHEAGGGAPPGPPVSPKVSTKSQRFTAHTSVSLPSSPIKTVGYKARTGSAPVGSLSAPTSPTKCAPSGLRASASLKTSTEETDDAWDRKISTSQRIGRSSLPNSPSKPDKAPSTPVRRPFADGRVASAPSPAVAAVVNKRTGAAASTSTEDALRTVPSQSTVNSAPSSPVSRTVDKGERAAPTSMLVATSELASALSKAARRTSVATPTETKAPGSPVKRDGTTPVSKSSEDSKSNELANALSKAAERASRPSRPKTPPRRRPPTRQPTELARFLGARAVKADQSSVSSLVAASPVTKKGVRAGLRPVPKPVAKPVKPEPEIPGNQEGGGGLGLVAQRRQSFVKNAVASVPLPTDDVTRSAVLKTKRPDDGPVEVHTLELTLPKPSAVSGATPEVSQSGSGGLVAQRRQSFAKAVIAPKPLNKTSAPRVPSIKTEPTSVGSVAVHTLQLTSPESTSVPAWKLALKKRRSVAPQGMNLSGSTDKNVVESLVNRSSTGTALTQEGAIGASFMEVSVEKQIPPSIETEADSGRPIVESICGRVPDVEEPRSSQTIAPSAKESVLEKDSDRSSTSLAFLSKFRPNEEGVIQDEDDSDDSGLQSMADDSDDMHFLDHGELGLADDNLLSPPPQAWKKVQHSMPEIDSGKSPDQMLRDARQRRKSYSQSRLAGLDSLLTRSRRRRRNSRAMGDVLNASIHLHESFTPDGLSLSMHWSSLSSLNTSLHRSHGLSVSYHGKPDTRKRTLDDTSNSSSSCIMAYHDKEWKKMVRDDMELMAEEMGELEQQMQQLERRRWSINQGSVKV